MIIFLTALITISIIVMMITLREAYIYYERLKLMKEIKSYEEKINTKNITPQELLFDLEHFDDRMKELDQKSKKLFPYIGGLK